MKAFVAAASGSTGGPAPGGAAAARLVSVNLGTPREVPWAGGTLRTGIFKEPVLRAVEVRLEGVVGDTVVDRRVHGGPQKRVYGYPREHYDYWQRELGRPSLPFGSFGENLTTVGLREAELYPGDTVEIGSVRLTITMARTPCVKLNARFGREDMIERFLRAGRSGFYFAVERPGVLAAGDLIRVRPGPRTEPSLPRNFRARTGLDEPT